MITNGTPDVEFVADSVDDLTAAANLVAGRIAAIETTWTEWERPEPGRSDDEPTPLLTQLRIIVHTLRAKAAELENVLWEQGVAGDALSHRRIGDVVAGGVLFR